MSPLRQETPKAYFLHHVVKWLARLGRHELGLLVLVALSAASLWVFVEVAGEVLEGDTHILDQRLLLAMRTADDPADPVGPDWFEELMHDWTALGSLGVLSFFALATGGFLILQGKYRATLFVFVAVVGGLILSSALKMGFNRPRPELVPHEARVLTASFPSGHSMLSAVTYLTLGALLARVQPQLRMKAYVLLLAILLTLCIGISRVYLGVHWPSDVLAGWTLGAAWALGCWSIALWLQRRGTVEQDKPEPAAAEP